MSSKITSTDFTVYLWARSTGKKYELKRRTEVLSASIEKSIFEPVGGFSFELRNDPSIDWEDIISNGDYTEIKVDGKLKMMGMVTSVGYGSSVQGGNLNNRLSVKVSDLGMLFTKFAKFLSNVVWNLQGQQTGLGTRFFQAFTDIASQYDYSTYNLLRVFYVSWVEIMSAFFDSVQDATGKPFLFSNNKTLVDAFQYSFRTISDSFNLNYPMTLHILSERFETLWQFWSMLAPYPFLELFCDTVYKGQNIAVFNKDSNYIKSELDTFSIVVRDNPWLGDNFEAMKPLANEIDPVNFVQINATKSAAEVKSIYLVYPEGCQNMAETFKGSGDFAVDTNYLGKWGFDFQEIALPFFKYDLNNWAKYCKGKATLVQQAYSKIDEYYAGAATMKYWDVRVGQCILIPQKAGSARRMYALATQVTDSFSAEDSGAFTQITFVRGEVIGKSLRRTI